MISERELARVCTPKTLQRARQIASSDQNILTKKCRFDHAGTHLSAFVASSHGWSDCYRTSISLDEDADRIIDFSCTCPAYLQYDGPCKHCAALAYSYNERPESFMGYKAHRTPETTACLADLIKRTHARQTGGVAAGSIDIEPTLVCAWRTWSVHFKILGGDGSTYVMKSISEFADNMRRGAFHSYGKKLAFVHAPEAFCPHGRSLAEFIDRAVAARERTRDGGVWGTRARDVAGRELDLNETELIELLDAMGNASFVVEGGDYGVRSRTVARVEHTDPDIKVELVKDDRGGFSIARHDDAMAIAHASRLYLWIDDVFYRCSAELARCAPFLRMLYAAESEALFVSESDLPLFCATVLPDIEETLQISAPESIDEYRPVPGNLEFYFDKTGSFITCKALACYKDAKRVLASVGARWSDSDARSLPIADETLERNAYALLDDYFGDAPSKRSKSTRDLHFLSLDSERRAADLLFGGLARFAQMGTVFTTDAFDRLTSDKKPRVSMGISLAGNLIDLDVHAEDLEQGELSALLASYRARKRYHRLKNGAFLDIAQLDLAELDRIARDLDITAAALNSGSVELPAYRAFYLDDALHDARRDGEFIAYVDRFRNAEITRRPVPKRLAATLRPYQEEGFHWMNALCDMQFGGILADEMGLGKSIQLISFLLSHIDETREAGLASLIVCPASLVYNWQSEIERFAPTLRTCVIAGTRQERMAARAANQADVLVTSYDLLRIDVKEYADREFFCCALDEAQYIKNHGTLTARAVKRVQARTRFALTGTPVENRLSEIWSIFDFLMPGFLGSYMRFRERFELDILGGNDDAAQRLHALVGPFMLRRLKSDVLPDLPDKLESVVRVPMTRKQEKLYLAHEQRLRESLAEQHARRKDEASRRGPSVEVLAELTRLRQICCDPRLAFEEYEERGAKVQAIAELIDSACRDSQKTLVFSQFTSFLSLIADELDAAGVPYYTITGSTPKKRRIELVEAFNEDDTPVFLVSLKAGGTGLNLTGASVVVHADPWWNAAAQDQATDRAHRIGQKSMVSVHQVIAKGTIEERIVALQQAKSELADKIVSAQGVALSRLTGDDLLELLQG